MRKRKPITLHSAIIQITMEAARDGNSVHIHTYIKILRQDYARGAITFAVHGLADGRVGAVNGMGLRHVGRGYYELTEV